MEAGRALSDRMSHHSTSLATTSPSWAFVPCGGGRTTTNFHVNAACTKQSVAAVHAAGAIPSASHGAVASVPKAAARRALQW